MQKRLVIVVFSLLYASLALARSYQVDVLLFAQPGEYSTLEKAKAPFPFLPIKRNAIRLGRNSNELYAILKPSQSHLLDEYYVLAHKSSYPVLGHYSWKQSSTKTIRVRLPYLNNKGWIIKGTVQVVAGNYYRFNSELQCSAPDNPQAVFTVSHRQGLEPGKIYYFDHAQLGMLVTIH